MEYRDNSRRVSADLFSPTVCRTLNPFLSPVYPDQDNTRVITPRRKLSLDDSSPSPLTVCSLGNTCKNASKDSPPSCVAGSRTPLGSLENICSRRKKVVRAKKLTLRLEKHNSDKDLFASPCNPISPLTTDSRAHPSALQINSPLERMSLASPSVNAEPTSSSSSSRHSTGTLESDGYSDVFDIELDEAIDSVPDSLTSLFKGTIQQYNPNDHKQHENSSILAISTSREGQSNEQVQPKSKHPFGGRKGSLKRCLTEKFSTEENSAKRPPLPVFSCPLSPTSSSPAKRNLKGVTLFRSQSCSMPPSENMYPPSPGDLETERIGDHTKPYALPIMKSPKVRDLKNITCETLCKLLKGEYSDIISKYTVVDCRYPYEYEGGHIKSSINIWEKDTLLKHFFTNPTYPCKDKREIVIFHCEFSSKRAPDMSRFTRKTDRERNGMHFPNLFLPELYLLDGGYKAFYEHNSSMCTPCTYRPMIDDKHKEQLKHFQKRSKSWTGGDNKRRHHNLRPSRANSLITPSFSSSSIH